MSYLAPINNYPLQALPDIARGAVEDIANLAKVSHGLAGAAVLSAMSVAIQRIIKVVLPSTASARPCCLYMWTVAGPGDGKTPADEYGTQAIREHEKAARERQEVRLKHFRAEFAVWTAQKRALLAEGSESAQVVERLRQHYEIEPSMPKHRSLLSKDVSERAVLEALDGKGRSLGVICDEGKILLKDSFQEKVGALNSAWSGGVLQLERANGVQLNAQDPRVTLSVMVQPDVLREFLEKRSSTSLRGSGFFARCLVSAPPSTQGFRWRGVKVPDTRRLDAFHDRIREILVQGDVREESGSEDVLLEFDADAANRWIEIGNYMEAQIQPINSGHVISDFLAKAPEQVARIAALFHVISKQPGRITVDTVEPPRILRRLFSLRGLSHEQEVKQVLTRGPRAGCSHGAGAPRRVPLAVGRH